MKKQFIFLIIICLFTNITQAQLNGIKNIPGNYASISTAIDSLNMFGVGNGGVIFNIAAGYTEIAPSCGFVITANGTIANTIAFKKTGTGNNPLLTAALLTTSTTYDGVIKIAGGDYITFDGIDIVENASNTIYQTDWGFALLKGNATAPFNGCQFITIKNCNISLNKTNTSSVGIYAGNHTGTSNANLPITATTDAMNFAKFYNNIISNVYIGISISGYSAISPYTLYDSNNEIGVDGLNTITNFGSANISVRGIYATNQKDLKIANNIINSSLNGLSSSAYGIFTQTGISSNVDIYNNNISLSFTSGSLTQNIYAIYNAMGNTAASNTVNIFNNNISNCNLSSASSGGLQGITNTATASIVNIFGNNINDNSLAGSGNFIGIFNNANLATNPLNIYSNNIFNNAKTGSSGNMFCSQALTATVNFHNNSIHNNSANGSSAFYAYYNSGAPVSEAYYNNTIYNLTHNGFGVLNAFHLVSTASGTKNIYKNNIYALNTGGSVNGLYCTSGNPANIYKNNIYNLSSSGTNNQAIAINYSGTTGNIYNNYISEIKATATNHTIGVIGINLGGSNQNLYYNTIYLDAISSSITTFGSAGIYKSATSIGEFRNNIIVNNSTAGPVGASYTVAFRISGEYNSNYYTGTSNNNCFYAGIPSASNLIFFDGINPEQTMSDFQTKVAPAEIASFSENPPFTNTISSPYNLHLQTNLSTGCESGGLKITIPSITDDFDENIRWGEAGYTGTASATDIGADEFEGIPNFNCTLPTPGNTIASDTLICSGNSTLLSLQNIILQTGIAYQWKSSVDGINYTDISGASSSNYSASPLMTTYYQCNVICKNGPVSISSTPILISIKSLPSNAGIITGTDTLCPGQMNIVYSVPQISNADSYIWEYSGNGASINATNNSISVSFSQTATDGNLTVKGHNLCGDGIISTFFPVHFLPLPDSAGLITGTAYICQGESNISFSVPAITNTTSYSWNYSGTGASITGNGNNISISFSTTATSGNLTVQGNNVCGNGPVSENFPITIRLLPGLAGNITGASTLCQGENGINYSVPSITDATSYIWSYSGTGASINGANNYITINFSATATSGNLTVKGLNNCGEGSISNNFAITVNPLPSSAPIISGPSSVCQGQSGVQFTISPISNASAYHWSYLGLGASISVNSNTISVNFAPNATSGNIIVNGNNACGNGNITSKYIAVFPVVENAGTITGITNICQGQNSISYSVPQIPNATSYLWTFPTGVIGSSSTNNITLNYTDSALSGLITVKGVNSCSEGLSSSLAITVNPLPIAASAISGATTICQGVNSIIYSIPSITNATSYSWTLPSGASGTSLTNTITVNYGLTSVSGNITVKGNNICGIGGSNSLAINVNPLPLAAGVISGPTSICHGQNAITYSIPTVGNATNYYWTLPSGVNGSSSTNSITVDYDTASVSGNITVKGNNTCGNGILSSLAINVNPLTAAAGSISGMTTVCQGQNQVIYTVPDIANATSYLWTLSSGATASGNSRSISVNYGTSALSGNISVKGRNLCGDGSSSTIAVIVNPLPSAAGIINGSPLVFQEQNSVIYTIAPIQNALSYEWTLPSGASGSSTTDSIIINYGPTAVSGNITVKGINNCGNGISASLPIIVDPTHNTIRLTVNGNNTVFTDEVIVGYGFTSDLGGAEKMFSIYPTAPNLYTTKFNKKWSINFLTNITQYSSVNMDFKAGVNGNYTITASVINSFSPQTFIYLKDKFTNTITYLNQNPAYTFTASVNDSSNRFQILFSSLPVRWLGNTSGNWNTASNWTNNILPSSNENIIIPSWAANQPHISSNSTSAAVCLNLTINDGASLTIDAGKALTINGLLTNNAGETGLILKSDSTGTASILNNTSNVIATVERYIPHTTSDEFHMLSSPVSNQAIAPSFNEQNGFFLWSEPNMLWIEFADSINFTSANAGNNFIQGKGYAVSYPNTITKYFKGILNQGSVNIPLTLSSGMYSGWNFIANPYPSSINWNSNTGWTRNILADAGNGEKAMWVWNATNGNYGAYISNTGSFGTNGVNSSIALSQGFWVKTTNTGILSMDNSIRIHSSHSFLKNQSTNSELIRISVSGSVNNFKDELILSLGNLTNIGGAEKMFSVEASAPSIYSTKMNKNWSINMLTSIIDNSTISIGFKAGVNGIYTISATGFEGSENIELEDLQTGIKHNLSANANYSFNALTTDFPDRFLLHFSTLGINENTIKTPEINYSNSTIIVNNPWLGKSTLFIYNINGRLLQLFDSKKGINQFQFKPIPGLYIFKLINQKQLFVKKVVVF
ncbi:MAG: T9SS type A sorting domain-containing protein [Bacteroidales bacterium]